MPIRVGGLWHCAGRGGGDGQTLAIVRYCENLTFMGAALSSVERHGPRDLARAKKWAGVPGVPAWHEPKREGTLVDGITYHDTGVGAALAAVEGADVVLSWGFPLHAVAHLIDVPIVEVAQGHDKFAKDITRKNAEHSDFKVAVSNTVGRNVWGDKYQWVTIYNGVDPLRAFPSMKNARQKLRDSWGADPDDVVVLMVQRLTPDKNGMAGVEAINKLEIEREAARLLNQDAGSRVRLVISGSGPDEPVIRDAIRRFTEPGSVLWSDDPWSHVGDLLAAADVFLLASESEGWPLSVMEAMLAGVPCVLSAHESHVELAGLAPGCCTLLRKDHDRTDLAAAIRHTARPEVAGPMKSLAYRLVRDNFTLPTVASEYEAAISSAIQYHEFHRRMPMMWQDGRQEGDRKRVSSAVERLDDSDATEDGQHGDQ